MSDDVFGSAAFMVDQVQVLTLSESIGLVWSADELEDVTQAVNNILSGYRELSAWSSVQSSDPAPKRDFRPAGTEGNELGAWKMRGSIRESATGPLQGVRVVVKDSIAVAGVTMSGGSALLSEFVPARDATVVRRVLEGGAEIVGTGVCEDLCFSGSSFTSSDGFVRNPYVHDRVSGGSTSGSAVIVANGEADVGIGTDQGGSIRGPASWCGLVGIKPTFGLIPYTGAMELERSVDHVGLLGRSAEVVDRVLQVVAGVDRDDPRTQPFDLDAPLRVLATNNRFRVGRVAEAFGWPVSDDETDAIVDEGIARFEKLFMTIKDVSIDGFRVGVSIFTPILAEGTTSMVLPSRGGSTNWPGWVDGAVLASLGEGVKHRPERLPLSLKINLLAGMQALDMAGVSGYALARAGASRLRAAVDRSLEACDLLALPTMPYAPPRFPPPGLPIREFSDEALGMSRNNCVFNLTGHPAVNIPCGMTGEGLPVGMTIVGRHGWDRLLLRIANDYANLYRVPRPGKEGVS
jgi:amidase